MYPSINYEFILDNILFFTNLLTVVVELYKHLDVYNESKFKEIDTYLDTTEIAPSKCRRFVCFTEHNVIVQIIC